MKTINISDGEITIHVNKQLFFTLFTEWHQLNYKKKWNWITITPIHIFLEWDGMCKGYLAQVVVLGFGIAVRFNTRKALELFKIWEKEYKETKKLSKAKKTKKVAAKKRKTT